MIFEESMASGEGTFTGLIAFGKSCRQTQGSLLTKRLFCTQDQFYLCFFENKERKLCTKIIVIKVLQKTKDQYLNEVEIETVNGRLYLFVS